LPEAAADEAGAIDGDAASDMKEILSLSGNQPYGILAWYSRANTLKAGRPLLEYSPAWLG
jgi:hypothetical protein